jgi:hypothetical protein
VLILLNWSLDVAWAFNLLVTFKCYESLTFCYVSRKTIKCDFLMNFGEIVEPSGRDSAVKS